MGSLQLTQKKLERARGQLGEKDTSVESLQNAARAMKHGRAKEGAGKSDEAPAIFILCARMIYGFARVVSDWVLSYAKLETSELCFDSESMTRSRRNRSGIVGKSGEGSMFVVAEKKMLPGCPLQLAPEMRQCMPSTEKGTVKFLKYTVEREILETGWKSMRSAGKRRKYVKKMAWNICLRRRVK